MCVGTDFIFSALETRVAQTAASSAARTDSRRATGSKVACSSVEISSSWISLEAGSDASFTYRAFERRLDDEAADEGRRVERGGGAMARGRAVDDRADAPAACQRP